MFGSRDTNNVFAVGFLTDSLAVLKPSIPSWQVSIRSFSTETTSSFLSVMGVLRGQMNQRMRRSDGRSGNASACGQSTMRVHGPCPDLGRRARTSELGRARQRAFRGVH